MFRGSGGFGLRLSCFGILVVHQTTFIVRAVNKFIVEYWRSMVAIVVITITQTATGHAGVNGHNTLSSIWKIRFMQAVATK